MEKLLFMAVPEHGCSTEW